jgi:hypothetical protein
MLGAKGLLQVVLSLGQHQQRGFSLGAQRA